MRRRSRARLRFRSPDASVMVQRTHPPRAKIGKKPALQGRYGVAFNASGRMADRASSLVQADTPDLQRHRDAQHRVVGRLYAQAQPALRAREPGQMGAADRRPPHRRHRLLYARAVQAGDPVHRARRHHPHLYRGGHRRPALGAARLYERGQGPSAVGRGDLRPDRRRPHSLEPAMGGRGAARGGAGAQAVELR